MFAFLKKSMAGFLTKPPVPQPRHDDEVLGRMAWSEPDEAWVGNYGGHEYGIAYECEPVPRQDLLEYAVEALGPRDWLEQALASARAAAVGEYPRLAEEIGRLRFGMVHLSRYQGVRRILADLEGGREGRSWRIEFRERECDGIGFDT